MTEENRGEASRIHGIEQDVPLWLQSAVTHCNVTID